MLHQKSLTPIRVSMSDLSQVPDATDTCTLQSAFSIRLAQYGFNVYDMIVPDLMHEFDLEVVADMLFELGNWYSLAKLRMHYDVTLENMDHATEHMYKAIKLFAATTCQNHTAVELPAESEACSRREKKKNPKAPGESGPRTVPFNVMNTIKYHCLGDHTEYIQRCGPTDNTTSETVSLENMISQSVSGSLTDIRERRNTSMSSMSTAVPTRWTTRCR